MLADAGSRKLLGELARDMGPRQAFISAPWSVHDGADSVVYARTDDLYAYIVLAPSSFPKIVLEELVDWHATSCKPLLAPLKSWWAAEHGKIIAGGLPDSWWAAESDIEGQANKAYAALCENIPTPCIGGADELSLRIAELKREMSRLCPLPATPSRSPH